jgi:hypothetical protein
MTIHVTDDAVFSKDDDASSHIQSTPLQVAAPAASGGEILFVDSGIADIQDVIANVRSGVQVVVLDSAHDALDQIATALAGRQDLSAIHIMADGEEGQIDFGAGALTRSSLMDHAADLAAIKDSLAPGGDLLLWTCNTGAGFAGQDFIKDLALATGANVAASTNRTGSSAAGGDFVLEAQTGAITATNPLTPAGITGFQGELTATTLTAGDIAFIGYATDDSGSQDTYSFVLLKDIGSGTQIFFTDRTWNGSTFSVSGTDGTFAYTAGGNLTAGTVITVTHAQVAGAGQNLDINGESLYAYQGTDANTPTSFLTAVDFADGNTTFNGSLANTGLTAGVNAVAIGQDDGAYAGRRSIRPARGLAPTMPARPP